TAVGETKTAFARRQPAKQADESGGKQGKANSPSNRPLPFHDQVPPQKRQHDEVGPYHDFEIVPAPRRRFHQERENKNSGRSENKGDLFGLLLPQSKSFFPNPVSEKANQRQQ